MVRPRNPLSDAGGWWNPSAAFLAQTNHILCGALVLLAADHAGLTLWATFAGLLSVAAMKEFILDIFVLERDSLLGSLADWIFYLLGGIGGWLACWHLATGAVAVGMVALLLTLADIAAQHAPQADDYD